MSQRTTIFNHVQIKVRDLKAARNFYDIIMGILEYEVVLYENIVVGYGTSVHDMFEIRQQDQDALLSHHVHIAFNAKNKDMVDRFYQAAIENGAKCNGKPGYRPQYEEGYYAAFVIELDGHNIEAVYSENVSTVGKA